MNDLNAKNAFSSDASRGKHSLWRLHWSISYCTGPTKEDWKSFILRY